MRPSPAKAEEPRGSLRDRRDVIDPRPEGPGHLTKASAALALAGGGGASRHACLVAKAKVAVWNGPRKL